MEMTYDGMLVMPSSYAVMDEEEMTYAEGGWRIDVKWWGYNVYLTHSERVKLTDGQIVAGLATALLSLGAMTAVIGALCSYIWNHDDGYGTRIRMTGHGATSFITGAFALKKSQASYAKKNKICW